MIDLTLFIGASLAAVLLFQRRDAFRLPSRFQEHGHWAISFVGFLLALAAGVFSLRVPMYLHFVSGIVDYNGWTRLLTAVGLIWLVVEIALAALPDFIVKVPMTQAKAVGTILVPAAGASLVGGLIASVMSLYLAIGHPVATFLQGVLPH